MPGISPHYFVRTLLSRWGKPALFCFLFQTSPAKRKGHLPPESRPLTHLYKKYTISRRRISGVGLNPSAWRRHTFPLPVHFLYTVEPLRMETPPCRETSASPVARRGPEAVQGVP